VCNESSNRKKKSMVLHDAAIVRLVDRLLLEPEEEWQLQRRRCFSEATMAKIPESEGRWSLPMVIRPSSRQQPLAERRQRLS
jgi:hypothetical protein